MAAFTQARGTNIGQMNQLTIKSTSLQSTINRLLVIAQNIPDTTERKLAEAGFYDNRNYLDDKSSRF